MSFSAETAPISFAGNITLVSGGERNSVSVELCKVITEISSGILNPFS